MKSMIEKTSKLIAILFAAHLAAGCAETPFETTETDEAVAEAASPLVDVSRLHPLQPMDRPERTFAADEALSNERLAAVLLAGERLVPEGRRADLALFQSESYRLQVNAQRGELYFRFKEERLSPVQDTALAPEALRDQAKRLLQGLGVPETEIGAVHQKRLLSQSTDQPGERTQAHATIVDRAFHGIPVRGSRAAVVFDTEGTLKHLALHWRPIAPRGTPGEQWSTRMAPEEIKARAAQKLASLGLDRRPAELRWQYVPVDEHREDGRTVLALKATAFVGIDPTSTLLERTVEIDIDLDP
jgi:hypothetical protein